MVKLVKYDAACHAIAAAKNVDEVKSIRDASIAMKAYARQAKNHTMEADAIEIRMRATRRMDQMRQDQKATVGLAKNKPGPGRGKKGGKAGLSKNPALSTLAEAGIDKNLAHEGRKLGALSEREFEKAVTTAREAVGSIIKTALRHDDKKERRNERERELAGKILALPDKKFGVILEDYEWDHETWSEAGKDRHASNHYLTSTDAHKAEEIVERTKGRFVCAADDCVLLMWSTVPHLAIAVDVMRLRGFKYCSHYIWGKEGNSGTGYWSRNKHELLLIGMRGKIPCPAQGTQRDSLIMAPRGEHSGKPECFLEMIEQYFPTVPKIELNRRGLPRPGWDAWGNELAEAAE